MCWVISQLHALWQVRHSLSDMQEGEEKGEWRPWEHIHPHPKGTLAPQINPLGKYCVRLYWMVSNSCVNIAYIGPQIGRLNRLFV